MSRNPIPDRPIMVRWWVALTGLFVSVFAVVALSGPGRIDIVDGQTRYEVARSLVEHGDSVIRDPRVWFAVFPGRDGRLYCNYRLPHSLAGAAAILAADASGSLSEARRHFFFTLTGAVACALMAVTYAAFFQLWGLPQRHALFWAAAGILCTPSWYYGTSTFDDILGSAAVVLAVCVALATRKRRTVTGAVFSGLAIGLAFHCKQPLGIFVLPVLGAIRDPALGWRQQFGRMLTIVALLLAAILVYKAYELYKFPPGSTTAHAALLRKYVRVWPGDPLTAILALTFSVGTSVFLYHPALIPSLVGLRNWRRADPVFCMATALAITVFTLFISSITFFKGDPSWGPRYFTPVFALLWIFAPACSPLLSRRLMAGFLVLGFIMQLGALSIDPHRLYVERGLPSGFYVSDPGLYFHPSISHLLNRPREIVEVIADGRIKAEAYSPSPSPTFAFPVLDFVEKGPGAVRKYHVLNSFRPWWASLRYLDRKSRPVDLSKTLILLAALGGAGVALVAIGIAGDRRRDDPPRDCSV
jgi:hypothetical protein